MSNSKCHEVRLARSEERLDFHFLPDSMVSFDRAYVEFKWLYTLDQRKVWFVTRAKSTMQYRIIGQHRPITNNQVKRDDKIELVIENREQTIRKPSAWSVILTLLPGKTMNSLPTT